MSEASDSRYGIRYLAHIFLVTHPVDWKALADYLRGLLTRNNRKYYKEITCDSDGVMVQVESRKLLFTDRTPAFPPRGAWVVVVDPSVEDRAVSFIRSGGELPIWGTTAPYNKAGLPPEPTHQSLTAHIPDNWKRAIWGLIGLYSWHSRSKWTVGPGVGVEVSNALTKLGVTHSLTSGTGWLSIECHGVHFSILKVRGPREGASTAGWVAPSEVLKTYHDLKALGPVQVVTNSVFPFPFPCKPKPPEPVEKNMVLYPCPLSNLKAVEWP